MNTDRIFRALCELGDNSSNSDYIDFDNGTSITHEDCEEILVEYNRINDEINDYVEAHDLDDVLDKEQIFAHFKQDADYFQLNQAVLINETEFAKKVYKNFAK